MTTKEQERQAIAKIRRIVEGLGENSYVGTAMEGVLEIAEENIECDAAFSLKGRAELAEKKEQELKKENEKLKSENEKLEKFLQMANRTLEESRKNEMPNWLKRDVETLIQNKLNKIEIDLREMADEMAEAIGENGNLTQKAVDLAKRYRELRAERSTLNRIKSFLWTHKSNSQE